MKLSLPLLIVLARAIPTAFSAETSVPPGFSPAAQWIGLATPSRPNPWVAFRREFTVTPSVKQVRARIAADSKYWLWINGQLVVFEGGLKRGPGPNSTYFDVVDLSPHLKPGSNRLATLLWHFGKPGFSHVDSGRAGLLVEFEDVSNGNVLLASDSTWRARPHPAYLDTDKLFPNYRLQESNIRSMTLNGTSVWSRGVVSRSLPTGVSQSPGNDPHVTFSLPPGKWRLVGTR